MESKSGVYEHKETGKRVFLEDNSPEAILIINAFTRVGFAKVADSEPEVVSEPTTESGAVEVVEGDKYTEKVNKNGKPMYYKNGKLISKEEYLNK